MSPISAHHWIVETSSIEEFLNNMDGVDLPIDSNVFMFMKSKVEIELYDVYRPQPSFPIKVSKWGQWNKKEGLKIFTTEKWELRRDLTGVYFTTSTANDPPYVVVRDVDLNNPPPGYQIDIRSSPVYIGPSLYGDIWSNLQQTLNFSYNMVVNMFKTVGKF